MTSVVVNRLQSVEVGDHDGEGSPVPTSSAELALKIPLEGAPIQQSGEGIYVGLCLQPSSHAARRHPDGAVNHHGHARQCFELLFWRHTALGVNPQRFPQTDELPHG